jgi:UDP-N-acetylglucosamine 1-carboxyvinyltransferase
MVVTGGSPLRGAVRVSGFKHSLVTVIGAACAARAPLVIANCPDLAETSVLAEMINGLGGTAHRGTGSLIVDAGEMSGNGLLDGPANQIHGSVYLVPGVLGRTGEAALPTDGGCQIGDERGGRRPVEQYLSVLERFGAHVDAAARRPVIRARRLTGCEIDLLDYTTNRPLRTGPLYSGACKMAILCAAVAHGTSVLHNLYPKPDVTDLVTVLRDFGADIETTLTGSLIVHGRGPDGLDRPVLHTLLPDLIEVVTWICAGTLLAGDELRIGGTGMPRALAALRPEREVFERMGVELGSTADELVVRRAESLRRTDLVVTSPGVYSDSHPFFALLATLADGTTSITETVWTKRFGYANGLTALGAEIAQHAGAVSVTGPRPPRVAGQTVHAPDLRAAAVLVLAALRVDGRTTVSGVHHLARGYPDFAGALRSLGADVHDLQEEFA